MRAAYRIFRGTWATWDTLLQEAAEFATRIGPGRLISIAHSEDKDDGVVVVWYWNEIPGAEDPTGGFPVIVK